MLFKFMNWKLVDTEALNLVYYANHVLLTPPHRFGTHVFSLTLYITLLCVERLRPPVRSEAPPEQELCGILGVPLTVPCTELDFISVGLIPDRRTHVCTRWE